MDQKKELGKGIRALLGNIDQNKPAVPKANPLASVQFISILSIESNPFQPRSEFESTALAELAESIKTQGIIQPITVRRINEGKYQLISGERRTRASKLAGLTEIPAYIRTADDQGMLEMALIENIQREDLNAIEVAISMARLMEECKLTHDVMSGRLGKDRSTVTNYLRLLKLPPDIQQAVKSKRLSMGHARALAGVDNLLLQMKLFKESVLHEWSVRQLEQTIKSYALKSRKELSAKPVINQSLSSRIDKANGIFGRKVNLKADKKGKGSIQFAFNDFEDLDELLDRLS